MTTAEQLLDDYNDYRNLTNGIQDLRSQGKHVQGLTRKHLPTFAELATWCAGHGIEPRRWLASLFESRRWLHTPKLNQLKSTPHLQRYPNMNAIPAYSHRLNQERTSRLHKAGKVYDPNRDTSESSEALKRRYVALGDTQRCMNQMRTETFGYHPKSQVCQNCPAQEECARRLQASVKFDIMSLRRGEITAESARVTVYYDSRSN